MTFEAIIHALRVDREGEGTLILKVPASDVEKIVPLTKRLEEVLTVSIE